MREMLLALLGRRESSTGELVVVTGRGVEIPIDDVKGWDVAALCHVLGEIDRLPETEEPTRA